MAAQRICLFGGTFDPIHQAHLKIADEAARRFALDRVLFIPAANPPHKPILDLTPYEDRFHMVELACAPYPQFSASRLEEGTERSYTVETLERVKATLDASDRLFFLIGSDAFDELQTWKRWQEVVELTAFIVVARPGGHYRVAPGARVYRLDDLNLPVSSSTIRARLAASEPTPELPPDVRRFIEEHALYGTGKRISTASPSRNTGRKLPSGA